MQQANQLDTCTKNSICILNPKGILYPAGSKLLAQGTGRGRSYSCGHVSEQLFLDSSTWFLHECTLMVIEHVLLGKALVPS